jgi:hypothetical protein
MDVTTDAIAHAIDGLHAIENTVRLKLLEHIRDYDRREAWREDGARSMADWLTFRHGYSSSFSLELVRVAQTLPELPAITAAYGDGRVSWDKVALVTQVATPEDDALWADEATGLSFATLTHWVRHHRRLRREEAAHELQERYLRFRRDGDATRMSARLPAAEAAVVQAAIDRIAEQAFSKRNEPYEAYATRAADALV